MRKSLICLIIVCYSINAFAFEHLRNNSFENYTSLHRTDVNDFIAIAQNGPVLFSNNVNAKFHAGNQIVIGPNFIANSNSHVEMKIVPCGTERRRNFEGNSINRDSLMKSRYNIKENMMFEIYPNPATNILKIKIPETYLGANIFVFDVFGNLVIQKNSIGKRLLEVDVESLVNGIYFLKLEKGKFNFSGRFIKM